MMMKLYTSYFDNAEYIKADQPNIVLISIETETPKWFLEKYHNEYKILAPLSFRVKEYQRLFCGIKSEKAINFFNRDYYNITLRDQSIKVVLNDLKNISNGNNVCLLTNEIDDKYSHRSIVRNWLNSKNVKCVEYFKPFNEITTSLERVMQLLQIRFMNNTSESTKSEVICYISDYLNFNKKVINVDLNKIRSVIENLSSIGVKNNNRIFNDFNNMNSNFTLNEEKTQSDIHDIKKSLISLSSFCKELANDHVKKIEDIKQKTEELKNKHDEFINMLKNNSNKNEKTLYAINEMNDSFQKAIKENNEKCLKIEEQIIEISNDNTIFENIENIAKKTEYLENKYNDLNAVDCALSNKIMDVEDDNSLRCDNIISKNELFKNQLSSTVLSINENISQTNKNNEKQFTDLSNNLSQKTEDINKKIQAKLLNIDDQLVFQNNQLNESKQDLTKKFNSLLSRYDEICKISKI